MPNSPTTLFPLYLFPSIPFRRRRSSNHSTSTVASSPGSPSTSPQPTSFLSSQPRHFLRCHKCLIDLIPTTSIISKGFTGRHGRAYLVASPPPSSLLTGSTNASSGAAACPMGDLPNTFTHKAVPRQLVTGAHTVSDISCRGCGSVLGWKYVDAAEETQKYKVGKFILETKRVVKGNVWEGFGEEQGGAGMGIAEDDIRFDSQDEDECEDLFSGIWTPRLAAARRRGRKGAGLR